MISFVSFLAFLCIDVARSEECFSSASDSIRTDSRTLLDSTKIFLGYLSLQLCAPCYGWRLQATLTNCKFRANTNFTNYLLWACPKKSTYSRICLLTKTLLVRGPRQILTTPNFPCASRNDNISMLRGRWKTWRVTLYRCRSLLLRKRRSSG